MKFYLLYFASIITFINPLQAQKGEYYLTHYAPEDAQIENENYAISEDANGQMHFANAKGVLKFEGRYWQVNRTPSTVLSLSTDKKTNIIYVGCLDDFGYISIDNKGDELYTSIYRSENNFISISKIVITEQFVYFQGTGSLFEYSKSQNKITHQWRSTSAWDFEIFKCKNEVFVSDKQKGILKVKNGKLRPVKTNLSKGEKVIFAPLINATAVFAATDSNRYYLFDGHNFKQIKLHDSEYLRNSVANDAIWVRDDLVIIATDKGGCVLVNPRTGKTISIINYYSGLPDNEIFAIGRDKQSCIWIAHEYGFTRLNYNLPFRSFTEYPGLEGNITATATYKNKIYVSTNEGLYYLDEIRDYKEIKKYVKVKVLMEAKRKGGDLVKSESKVGQDKYLVRNRLNTKYSDRKKSNISKKIKAKPVAPVMKLVEQIKTIINFELLSVKYAYKKVKGIDAKCRQLLTFKDKLLLATNNGVFEIEDSLATKIIPDAISYLYISNNKKRFLAGTDDHKLLVFKYEGQKWVPEKAFDDLPESVFNITEDKHNFVWVSLSNSILRYAPLLNRADTLKIKNPYSDDIHLVYAFNKVCAFIGNNTFYYDEKSHNLVKDGQIRKDTNAVQFSHAENGIIWYNNGQQWNIISDALKINKNLAYLQLLKDVQKIFYDKSRNQCWVITKNNNLYNLNMNNLEGIKNGSNIFLKSVKDNEGKALGINKVIINQNLGNVSFSFVSPEYLDSKSQQYSYMLKGFYNKWSAWSNDNEVKFGYLPDGKYSLLVKTKNALGQISESKPLAFKVKPPYWQEWWFYLAEFIFFGSLVWISIWLNTSGQQGQWITKGLTFLTVVMMIELVNTVFESIFDIEGSPVLSFLVQVLLAIMIFPLERLLALFITRDPKSELARLAMGMKAAFRPINKQPEILQVDK